MSDKCVVCDKPFLNVEMRQGRPGGPAHIDCTWFPQSVRVDLTDGQVRQEEDK